MPVRCSGVTWLISHRHRKMMNIAVMKSASAIFQVVEPWAVPWPFFLRRLTMIGGRFEPAATACSSDRRQRRYRGFDLVEGRAHIRHQRLAGELDRHRGGIALHMGEDARLHALEIFHLGLDVLPRGGRDRAD